MTAIDLHVHSNRSDGTFSPAALVDYAMEKRLGAFALTDHDTVEGLEEAVEYARDLRARLESGTEGFSGNTAGAFKDDTPAVPEVIPGIEFSTEYQGRDIHILGLYINYKNDAFRARLQAFVDSRDARNRKMCLRLQEAGIPVTYEDLREEFPDAVITRAHYAKYMLGHGHVKSMGEAFDRYIGDRCPCFVPREKVTPVQAVKLVLQAEGVPVLAHPILYRMSDERLEDLTAELTAAGLGGLEAVYSTYSPAEERRMRALAARHGLLITGGSDFHGANKPGLDLGTGYGKLYVPYCCLEDLKRRKASFHN